MNLFANMLYKASCFQNWLLFAVLLSVTTAKDDIGESFKQCLITRPSETLGYCLGVGAITKLQTLENDPEFDIADGVTFARDEQQYREAYNFVDNSNPGSFRSFIDSMDHVFSRRKLHWGMDFLYPGLAMRVAPSLSPGGVLEFALDPHRDSLVKHNLKEVGTGHVVARQFLVPLLLGFKFNVATLIPIIFGILALVIKKAVIFSKIALIVSVAYALSNMVFSNGYGHQTQHNGHQGPQPEYFGNYHHNRYKEEEANYYKSKINSFADQIRLNGQIPVDEVFAREGQAKGRNFAWSDDEQKNKT